MKYIKGIALLLFLLTAFSCKFNYIDKSDFEGTWELTGRPGVSGMLVEISQRNDRYTGTIVRPPDAKELAGFLQEGSLWISSIQRNSNFQFIIVEKRPAETLMHQYDLPTVTEWHVEFIHKDTLGLSRGESDPQNSKIRYIRVKK
jgi:hypothetical protein